MQNSIVKDESASAVAGLRQALALQNAGRLNEAAGMSCAVLRSDPDDTNAWNLLGTVSVRRGDLARARTQFEKAVSFSQESAEAHHNLGMLLRQLGEMGCSRHHLEEALRLKPGYADAYFNYAACRRFEPGDPLAATIENLLQCDDLPEDDFCPLHFAAGKIYSSPKMSSEGPSLGRSWPL